jgi:hypothetical protein
MPQRLKQIEIQLKHAADCSEWRRCAGRKHRVSPVVCS